ncbi:MAG: UDP-N-acetylmuramoyl-L-alanine--D-glutamate ligase [bacterium]|nr:UDP-N-acetylmuramoyl-L-alanine--D-glutamate ligase [bacterium]
MARELRARGIWVELGGHTPACVEGVDIVVTSPGVAEQAQPLQWARARGIPVISEIEFAVRHTNARIVAITGTNGKTTTTALIGHVLRTAGMPVVVAGNIGQALSGVVEEASAEHTLVLEISSFQLETVSSFKPYVAVWLNLTPDHLDRYGTMEAYAAAKGRIFMNMGGGDWAVIWEHDRMVTGPFLEGKDVTRVWLDEKGTWRATREEPCGAQLQGGELVTIFNGVRQTHGKVAEMRLMGAHNVVNMLAACAVGRILHVPGHVVGEALRSFNGLPHRLERVAEGHGLVFINDSKATNIDAMVKGLAATPGPLVLLAGGYDKGGDFRVAAPLVKEKAVRVVAFGRAREKVVAAFREVAPVVVAESMADAVAKAAKDVPEGTRILLSPGCASYDMYNDFEERGNDFRRCAREYLERL